eukprot:354945_1
MMSHHIIRYNDQNVQQNYAANQMTQSCQKHGTMYYYQCGDRVNDYINLKLSPFSLNYNASQHTLICGECDFSFTSSLIQKRNSGINCCSTAWCYYKQWIKNLTKDIGANKFKIFEQNLQFC